MAISTDLSALQELKESEHEKRYISEKKKIKELEEEIDRYIAINHRISTVTKTTTKGWLFWKKTLSKRKIRRVEVILNYGRLSRSDTLRFLEDWGLLHRFLQCYKSAGWNYNIDLPILHFWKETVIEDDEAGSAFLITNGQEKKLTIEKELAEARRALESAKARVAELEAEIQFLTESPNSRDPKLLPQKANG